MYKRVIIIGYKLGSASVKLLHEGLKQQVTQPVLKVSKLSTKYQPRYSDYIINWGCSIDWNFITLDDKTGHKTSVNKLAFFEIVSGWNKGPNTQLHINIPEWTTDKAVATTWGEDVVCRTKLDGHSGIGIVLGIVVDAPLYVKYKKKRHEYRVHFFKQKDGTLSVIDVTQKKKRKGAEHLDTKIRNHQNGWVYCREDITEPDDLRAQALNAAAAVGLRFGAVDLIWNEKENKSYVLEINTAPGLVGTTLTKYIDAFAKDIKNV